MGDLHFGNFAPDWPPVDYQNRAPNDGMSVELSVEKPDMMDVDFAEYINFSPEHQQSLAISSSDRNVGQAPINQSLGVQQSHANDQLATPQHRAARLAAIPASDIPQTPDTGKFDLIATHVQAAPNPELLPPTTPTRAGLLYPTPTSKNPQTRRTSQAPPEAETPSKRSAKPQGRPRRTIPCPWEGCKRELAGQHNLTQHIRERHTGERPFVCEECAKINNVSAFARPGTLYRHLRDLHGIDAGPGRGQKKQGGGGQGGGKKKAVATVTGIGDGQASNPGTDVDMGGIENVHPATPAPAATPEFTDVDLRIFDDEQDLWAPGFDTDFPMRHHIPDNFDPALFTNPEESTLPQEETQFNFPTLHDVPGGRFQCGSCGYTRNDHMDVIYHMHAAHAEEARYGDMCSCFVCEAFHEDHQGPEVVHERLLNMPRPELAKLNTDSGNAEAEHERLLNMPRPDAVDAALACEARVDQEGADDFAGLV